MRDRRDTGKAVEAGKQSLTCILCVLAVEAVHESFKLFRMLRDLVVSALPVLSHWWCHNPPSAAELVLWTLLVFWIGFISGGLVVSFILSAGCRRWTARLLLSALEGQEEAPQPLPRAGRNRLLAYRA